MLNPKPSHLLAALAWISVFMEAWLILKGQIGFDLLSGFFFLFFLAVAFVASIAASEKPKGAK